MNDAQAQDALAAMRERIIESRRQSTAESIALRHYRETGAVDADAVALELDVAFTPPSDKELNDLVARKAAAAVEYHTREAAAVAAGAANLANKVARLEAQLAEAQDALAAAEDADANTDVADAEAILAAAIAAGGDAGGAGMDAQARAAVADAVGDAMGR